MIEYIMNPAKNPEIPPKNRYLNRSFLYMTHPAAIAATKASIMEKIMRRVLPKPPREEAITETKIKTISPPRPVVNSSKISAPMKQMSTPTSRKMIPISQGP